MKRLPENQVQFDEDDDDFLAQVAAVESHALSHNKRFKSTPASASASVTAITTTFPANSVNKKNQAPEGAYLAALRGVTPRQLLDQQRNHFSSAQSRVFSSGSRLKVVTADAGGDQLGAGGDQLGAVADGACFRCGKSGHWSRDCDSVRVGEGMQQSSEPERACPCRSGVCLVLTANTEKNKGRRFYKCPIRQENGGCGFFEWCDNASGMAVTNTNYNNNVNTFPDLACPCNAGSCLILTVKSGKNVGQQFYRCPANQANSCGFFRWCNDQNAAVHVSASTNNTVYSNGGSFKDTNSRTYAVGGGSSSSCFKCGKEGHWARDCSSSSSSSEPHSGFNTKSSSSSNSCYKCGKVGHWAKDCLLK